MYRCTKCNLIFRKHRNAVAHVINDHHEPQWFAQFYVMVIPDMLYRDVKPVDA
jgi:hypothetical protein